MKRRNKRKMLLRAVRGLNNKVTKNLEFPPISEKRLREVFFKMRSYSHPMNN